MIVFLVVKEVLARQTPRPVITPGGPQWQATAAARGAPRGSQNAAQPRPLHSTAKRLTVPDPLSTARRGSSLVNRATSPVLLTSGRSPRSSFRASLVGSAQHPTVGLGTDSPRLGCDPQGTDSLDEPSLKHRPVPKGKFCTSRVDPTASSSAKTTSFRRGTTQSIPGKRRPHPNRQREAALSPVKDN